MFLSWQLRLTEKLKIKLKQISYITFFSITKNIILIRLTNLQSTPLQLGFRFGLLQKQSKISLVY